MGFGLLRDVEDFSNATQYSTELRLSTNLLEPELFYQAATFDAKKKKLVDVDEYLQTIYHRLNTFFASDKVHGRLALKERVQHAMKEKDCGVTFLLGRRSVGKTKLLLEQVKATNDAPESETFVVYVDGRKTPSLAQGIRLALQSFDDKKMFVNVPWEAMRMGLQGGQASPDTTTTTPTETNGSPNGKKSGCTSFAQLCTSIQGKDDQDSKLIELIVLLAAAKKKRPCLVVDEASSCLACDKGNKTTLAMIYGLTKDHAMNVLLCSSNFDYPRHIAESSGIQRSLTRTLYMEEYSPQSMWDLLVEATNEEDDEPTVGMGNKLARFCISFFGGNPRTVQQALHILLERKGKFTAFGDMINYDIDGASNLEKFLDEKKSKKDKKNLMKILDQLGGQGYWVIEPGKSALVDRLVSDNVANSVLTSDLMECPLDEESYRVLIPSSQIIRHLIVEQVNDRRSSGLFSFLSGKGK